MSETPCGKGKATVLVVEDDPDFAEIVTTALESSAFTVVTAANKDEGLALARAKRPDCIVLDVMMPTGTEGFHFVWELRKDADQEVRETPILIPCCPDTHLASRMLVELLSWYRLRPWTLMGWEGAEDGKGCRAGIGLGGPACDRHRGAGAVPYRMHPRRNPAQ